jgi:amino acid transporter
MKRADKEKENDKDKENVALVIVPGGKDIILDDDHELRKMRDRLSDTSTVEMLDVLVKFVFVMTVITGLVVGVYMAVYFPRQETWDKLKPEAVVISCIETMLIVCGALLFIVRRRPEGKVIIYSIVLYIDGCLSGFTLFVIFRTLIDSISD